jgi:hypothetical protein
VGSLTCKLEKDSGTRELCAVQSASDEVEQHWYTTDYISTFDGGGTGINR